MLAEFLPDVAEIGRDAVERLRALMPSADVLVYDNYNYLVAGFSFSGRPGDAFLSVALYARGVNLFFLRGATLPDPSRILEGAGKTVRHVRLTSADDLDRPALRALLRKAMAASAGRDGESRRGGFRVVSISTKKRARRPN